MAPGGVRVTLSMRELALLCELARFDVPGSLLPRIDCCLTAGMFAAALESTEPENALLKAIPNNRALSSLQMIDYRNRNGQTGFVGCAWAVKGGETVCVFRSSEARALGDGGFEDWTDNFLAPFSGSVQYPDVRAFIAPYKNREKLVFTGHSKGAHNALYALSVTQNLHAVCRCFDGQGFSLGQIKGDAARRLQTRAVNFVQQNDIVGALLCHPETRVFVKSVAGRNAHALDALSFDILGEAVAGRRPCLSRVVQLASCAAASFLQIKAGSARPGGLTWHLSNDKI